MAKVVALQEWIAPAVLVIAGFVAGLVNTIAGGGSFLTIPALLLAGLDVGDANGTNRVAIVLQTATATGVYHRRGALDLSSMNRILPPMLVGAVVGAGLAAQLSDTWLRGAFGVLFLAMVIVVAARPDMVAEPGGQARPWPVRWLVFCLIGAYGGFIQAGVGVLFLIGTSACLGLGLVAANGVKNAVVFVFTLAALGVFAYRGQVQWGWGLLLGVGNVAGGYIGAKLAIDKGQRLIRGFVLAVMVLTGARLLWTAVGGEG